MIDLDEKIILNFLKKNYPVYRLKYKKRFKRAIILDNNEIFYLSDGISMNNLYYKLLDIVKILFYIDEKKSGDILKLYLNLK